MERKINKIKKTESRCHALTNAHIHTRTLVCANVIWPKITNLKKMEIVHTCNPGLGHVIQFLYLEFDYIQCLCCSYFCWILALVNTENK